MHVIFFCFFLVFILYFNNKRKNQLNYFFFFQIRAHTHISFVLPFVFSEILGFRFLQIRVLLLLQWSSMVVENVEGHKDLWMAMVDSRNLSKVTVFAILFSTFSTHFLVFVLVASYSFWYFSSISTVKSRLS